MIMKIRNMYTLKEMKEKSLEFYKGLNVETSQENILLAVRSLTMPQYAKEYKDKYGETIGDHTALATVGDAVCGAFLMLDRYTDEKTSKTLTEEKEIVKNDRLNVIGKKMLCDEDGIFLFASNNDLESNNEDHPNKKAYATAFEAIIGFIALLDKDQKTNNADRILKEYLSNI